MLDQRNVGKGMSRRKVHLATRNALRQTQIEIGLPGVRRPKGLGFHWRAEKFTLLSIGQAARVSCSGTYVRLSLAIADMRESQLKKERA